VTLSLASSIDALAVGVSFGILRNAVLILALIIGIVCCAISFAGVMHCEQLEDILDNKMEIAGGIILIPIGVKSLRNICLSEKTTFSRSLQPSIRVQIQEKRWMQDAPIIT
jgi:putative Mn2+ efflux pump MntP